MSLSKCAICGSKKSRFMKEQEAKGILSRLSLKLLSKIALLSDVLFWMKIIKIIKIIKWMKY